MAVLGLFTPAWSGRTIISRGLVKKMTKFFFSRTELPEVPGGVTWRQRGVFLIRLDRCKAQSVYFLNMHGRARSSHTGLERSDHHGSEVGPKNGKIFFFKTGLPEVLGGVTWRHRGVFPIRLDRWKAQSVYFLNLLTVPGRPTPAWSGWTIMGRRSVQKMANFFFQNLVARSIWGGNLAPPWSFSNPFGPLESPKCLLFEYAWPC